MLNIEILKQKKMQMSGSKILDSIQNKTMQNIDLFVREAVQNSIDAFDTRQKSSEINIDINYKSFDSYALCNKLEMIGEVISKRNDLVDNYLSFSDKNCIGLVGDLDPEVVSKFANKQDQNLYNLVYDVMYKKSESNSGGSWGIGKTSFYRLGIGIIFYYSRIKINNEYQSRLVGVLIENELRSNSIIKTSEYSGIAFFGKQKNDYTIPVTDDHEILSFLSVFDLKPYEGNETGTILIIPYVDEMVFLPNCQGNFGRNTIFPWERDLRKAFELSFQKWYFPRFNNKSVKPYISLTYNGNKFDSFNTFEVFKHLQLMYNYKFSDHELYQVKDIEIKDLGIVGRFIFGVFDDDQLKINPPHNQHSPFQFLGIVHDDEDAIDSNEPIIMFTRKPGMIIDYKKSFPWVSPKLSTPPNQYFIGIFILETNDELEAYFRASEKADHMDWGDIGSFTNKKMVDLQPFKLITSRLRKIQKAQQQNQDDPISEDNLKELGKILANMLLPNEDYGDLPTLKTPPNGRGGGTVIGKSRIHKLSIEDISYEKYLTMLVRLQWKSTINKIEIFFKILSGSKAISIDEWNQIGLDSPFKIEKIGVFILQIDKNKNIKNNTFFFNENQSITAFEDFTIEKIISENGSTIGYRFNNIKHIEIDIRIALYLTVIDKSINIDLVHTIDRGNSDE